MELRWRVGKLLLDVIETNQWCQNRMKGNPKRHLTDLNTTFCVPSAEAVSNNNNFLRHYQRPITERHCRTTEIKSATRYGLTIQN